MNHIRNAIRMERCLRKSDHLKNIMCLIACAFAFATTTHSQVPAPGMPVDKKMLFLGGTAHIGNGKVVKNAAISVENGYFAFVENQMFRRIDTGDYDTIIRLRDIHYYPGFIAPNTGLGLTEIGAVRATRDERETGDFNPNVRSLIAYNTDSKITPTVRTNGVLTAQITPSGGIISGSSSVVYLDAWNWEDAVLKADDGIHLRWPERFTRKGEKTDSERKKIEEIEDFLEGAAAYSSREKRDPVNLRYEAMRDVFTGEKRLYVHCDQARSIVKAAEIKRKYKIPKMVIAGGYDAHLIPEVLKDNDITVIYRRPHSLPQREDDPIHLPYMIPAKLNEAGILFCIDMSGGMEAMNQRNLPFTAGTAAAYGLGKEKALQAVTLNAAVIMGIDERTGSLQAGKEATFFISTGDALDMRTNNVIHAFIKGRELDLNNHQKMLRDKFRGKYER